MKLVIFQIGLINFDLYLIGKWEGKIEAMFFGFDKHYLITTSLNIFYGDKGINVTDSCKDKGAYLDQSLNIRSYLNKLYT